MVEGLNTSRDAVATAYLVGTLGGATAVPWFGRLVDRFGVRRAHVVIGVGFAVALVHMAGITNVYWLALGYCGIRMFGQGALSLIPTVAVSLWFKRRRGLVMGILGTLGGGLMSLVPIVLGTAIDLTSWRTAWLLAAGVIFVAVPAIGWFGYIDRPTDVDQHPDGVRPDEEPVDDDFVDDDREADSKHLAESDHFTRAEAFVTRQFWVLVAISTTTGMLSTGLNFHQIGLLGEVGLSDSEAARMFLPQIIGSSTLSLTVGYLIDRFGGRYMPAISMLLLALVHLVASSLVGGAIIVLYSISLGAAGGAVRATLSSMMPNYFGTLHLGAIQGAMAVTSVAGSALGPLVLSTVANAMGSFKSANLVMMLIPLMVAFGCLTNRPLPARATTAE